MEVEGKAGENEADAGEPTVDSVHAEEGRKTEVDTRGEASSGQQWWMSRCGKPQPGGIMHPPKPRG